MLLGNVLMLYVAQLGSAQMMRVVFFINKAKKLLIFKLTRFETIKSRLEKYNN